MSRFPFFVIPALLWLGGCHSSPDGVADGASSSLIASVASSSSSTAPASSVASSVPGSSSTASDPILSSAVSSLSSTPSSLEAYSSALSSLPLSSPSSAAGSLAASSEASSQTVSSRDALSSAASSVAGAAMVRVDAVTPREHGYSNFETLVLHDQASYAAFTQDVAQQEGWNDKTAFLQSLSTTDIDFATESLLLFRHTETSGSNVIIPHAPQSTRHEANVTIDVLIPPAGTDDMAYYLYVYRVAKTIKTVHFLVDGTDKPIVMPAPVVCTEQYAPVCGARSVVCITEPCGSVKVTFGNLCMLCNETDVRYVHDGECNATSTSRSVTAPDAIVRADESLGVQMLGHYLDPAENLFFSPYSMVTALAMTYEGTYGATAEDFASFFGFDANLSAATSFATLMQNPAQANTFTSANAIWPQADFGFYPGYYALVERYYGASVIPMDFLRDAEAYRTINAWVEVQTNGKIRDIIPAPLSALTRMVLVNAVYFKGTWLRAFDENATTEAPFFLDDQSSVPVQMMAAYDDFNFTVTDRYVAVELPYAAREYSMIAIQPNGLHTLEELVEDIDTDGLQSIIDGLTPQTVHVYLPKFKIRWGTENITDVVQDLGLVAPFSSVADFRLMADVQPGDLVISQVLHQAFIEVNEAGTEAAAATVVVIDVTSLPDAPIEFRGNRPFLYFIRDNRTGMILFVGVLADPSE